MTPVISPWFFYLSYILGNLSFILSVAAVLAAIVCVILFCVTVGYYCDSDFRDEAKRYCRALKTIVVPVTIALLVAASVFPDSATLTKMVVAQNVTYERVEGAADIVQTVYEDIMNLFEEDTDEN